MRAQALLWVLSCTLGITCMASAAPTTPPPSAHALRAQAAPRLSRSDALARLKELEKKYSQDIESTNQSMRRILSESQSVSLHQSDSVRTEKHLLSLPQRLADLQRQRQDLLLKREFLDQLIFHIDSKWTTQPLSLLLEQTLLDMAGSELTSSQPQTQDKPDFWRFYIYLS
ncbi:MAG: hypothetical protein NDI61_03750, partial [Bdellovibrionaceae bacterium]|nr:hypothetical protein [Pseudobdellovibrionaceae bacterium]